MLTPSPSIFTDEFSPSASYDHCKQEMFHWNKGKLNLYHTHTKIVCENYLRATLTWGAQV